MTIERTEARVNTLKTSDKMITIPPMELSSEEESDLAKPEKVKQGIRQQHAHLNVL